MRLAIAMALISLPLALVLVAYIIGSWLLGFSVAGWASVMTVTVGAVKSGNTSTGMVEDT